MNHGWTTGLENRTERFRKTKGKDNIFPDMPRQRPDGKKSKSLQPVKGLMHHPPFLASLVFVVAFANYIRCDISVIMTHREVSDYEFALFMIHTMIKMREKI